MPLLTENYKLFPPLSTKLLAGADDRWLLALDLEKDPSRYHYLSMGGEASQTTSNDKKLYNEVRRAMGVSSIKFLLATFSQSIVRGVARGIVLPASPDFFHNNYHSWSMFLSHAVSWVH